MRPATCLPAILGYTKCRTEPRMAHSGFSPSSPKRPVVHRCIGQCGAMAPTTTTPVLNPLVGRIAPHSPSALRASSLACAVERGQLRRSQPASTGDRSHSKAVCWKCRARLTPWPFPWPFHGVKTGRAVCLPDRYSRPEKSSRPWRGQAIGLDFEVFPTFSHAHGCTSGITPDHDKTDLVPTSRQIDAPCPTRQR